LLYIIGKNYTQQVADQGFRRKKTGGMNAACRLPISND